MDQTAAITTSRPRRRWRRVALLGALIAGVMLGSATTSVVWASHQFSDVPTSSPFHADISWAADHDIVNGFPDGKFHPADPVSRQAAAAILHRYNGELEVVHNAGTMTTTTFTVNTVTCPAGKRPLSGGGNTNAANLFITDVIISPTTLTVRWESDNNAVISASTDAWALCGPA